MKLIPRMSRRELEILAAGIAIGMIWLLALEAMTGRADEATPSQLIKTADLPGVISLSGTTGGSLKAIGNTNAELKGTRAKWMLQDIGYYFSDTRNEEQEDNVGMTKSMINFTGNVPVIPQSIGNATNATEINKTSEGLLYL